MSVKTVYVLRHGEPEDRTIFYGQLDVGLSEKGEGHVQAQAAFFADRPLRTIVSSDLTRCTRGAQAIGQRCGVEVTTRKALREMHLGLLEGVPMAEALERMPELAGRSYMDMLDYAFPEGGESVRTVAARVLPVVEEVVREADGDILFYVHNSVARVILAAACGLGPEGYVRFEQRYGAINRLRIDTAADTLWARSAIVYANRAP